MKIVAVIIAVLLFGSCAKKPITKTVKIIQNDSSSTKITDTYKDTTVTIPAVISSTTNNITSAIQAINKAIPTDSTVTVFNAVSKKEHITQTINLDNKGNLTVECKADSLKKVISWLNTRLLEMFLQKNRTEKIQVEVPGPKVPTPYIPPWVYWVIGYAALITVYLFRNPIANILSKFK